MSDINALISPEFTEIIAFKSETYSMDTYFRQTWKDTRLEFSGPHEIMSVHIKFLERIWKPDTFFYNGHGSYLHTITTPNKLLRIMKNGTILYSMRLTIKATCPMYLQQFPMDEQSCPLQFGSYAYTREQIYYEWKYGTDRSIKAASDMRLSQYDLTSFPAWNLTVLRMGGEFSTLKVNFMLQRHMGYFLIQVYVPCTLIVVLSWVSFWINREATADRVGLGITTVLTLTTLSMDTRDDLPKVSYATALDWYVITCFGFVIGTLLEYAAVHYFTKIGSGEVNHETDSEGEEEEEEEEVEVFMPQNHVLRRGNNSYLVHDKTVFPVVYRRPPTHRHADPRSFPTRLPDPRHADPRSFPTRLPDPRHADPRSFPTRLPDPRHADPHTFPTRLPDPRHADPWTLPAPPRLPDPRQDDCLTKFCKCLQGSHYYRKLMQRHSQRSGVNSVSLIDKVSRILFPLSFITLNIIYWIAYTR